MTALDLPLFGDPDPVQRPGKTALGYLSWLNDVDVDGWRFWALAGSVERGLTREALIDLDELRVIRWVTR